jgi:hypothetical protein
MVEAADLQREHVPTVAVGGGGELADELLDAAEERVVLGLVRLDAQLQVVVPSLQGAQPSEERGVGGLGVGGALRTTPSILIPTFLCMLCTFHGVSTSPLDIVAPSRKSASSEVVSRNGWLFVASQGTAKQPLAERFA